MVKGPAAAIKTRCDAVKKSIQHAPDCSDRVKQMLCNSLSFTVGTHKAERHPFNERFVAMIEQVLAAEDARLKNVVSSLDAAFTELSPAKATREAALEHAKAVSAEKGAASDAANQAVTEIGATVKAANAEVKEMKKAQTAGDEEVEGSVAKKAQLEEAMTNSFGPLVAGTSGDDKAKQIKAVFAIAKSFEFDKSLMSTAQQVFQREAAERGAFDQTCLEQLQAAFSSSVAKCQEEIEAGAPAKAERAAAVERAEAAKTAAEATQTDLKAKAAEAKDAKAAAASEQQAAAKSLADFMPDLKAAGDGLDAARQTLKSFEEGPRVTFNELKEYKEGDFMPKKRYYEKIDGMSCDREVIDACRAAVAGAADGQVSVADAKNVFEAIADGGKETRCERWTLRYCMEEFKWTDAAHDWIIEELKRVPQEENPAKKARTSGAGYYEMIDGFKCDRGIVDTCREAVIGQGDGRVSVEDAQKVWGKAADGNKITNTEKWTLRYCFSAFNWTRAGHEFMVEQLKKGPEAAVAAPWSA